LHPRIREPFRRDRHDVARVGVTDVDSHPVVAAIHESQWYFGH
jgi:hypothetical protein